MTDQANITNIMLGAVGGQGLVLTTKIISEAAMLSGFDVKTNDVVGLSQRGGKIWGTVRFGEKIWSPNIEVGRCDILLGLEALEGYRWRHFLKPNGLCILNTYRLPPVPVVFEKEEYPDDLGERLMGVNRVITLDAVEIAREIGSTKLFNTVLLGVLSKELSITKSAWLESIEKNVPQNIIALNLKAFEKGAQY